MKKYIIYSIRILIIFFGSTSNLICMKSSDTQRIISECLGTDSSPETEPEITEKIKLVFEDGQLEISKKAALESKTLKDIIDQQEESADSSIPLPNIYTETGKILVNLMEKLASTTDKSAEIKKILNNLSNIDLVQLLEAANFLDIETLLPKIVEDIGQKLNNLNSKDAQELLKARDLLKSILSELPDNLLDLLNITNYIWEYSNKELNPFKVMALSFDGHTIAGINETGLYIFDEQGNKIGSNKERIYDHVAVNANGEIIAAVSDKIVYIFNKYGKPINTINIANTQESEGEKKFIGITSNGNIIVTTTHSSKLIFRLEIFNQNGEKINDDQRSFRVYRDQNPLNKNGTIITLVGAKGQYQGYVYIFDQNGNEIGKNETTSAFIGLDASPDGNIIVARTVGELRMKYDYGPLYILNQNGEEIGRIEKKGAVVSISPDGNLIFVHSFVHSYEYLYLFDRSGKEIGVTKENYIYLIPDHTENYIIAIKTDGSCDLLNKNLEKIKELNVKFLTDIKAHTDFNKYASSIISYNREKSFIFYRVLSQTAYEIINELTAARRKYIKEYLQEKGFELKSLKQAAATS